MIRFKITGIGEIPFCVNKGAIGEWESYFLSTWLTIITTGLNYKHWHVLMHKCYLMGCLKDSVKNEYSLEQFQALIDGQEYTDLVNLLDIEMNVVLELEKLTKQLNETSKSSKKK
jgi:hypothetical protein